MKMTNYRLQTEIENINTDKTVWFKNYVRQVLESNKPYHAKADYIGLSIKELDNNLPPWWVWLGYATIVFAIVYSTYYWWTGTGLTQEEEWAQEMAYAKTQKEAAAKELASKFDETNVKIVTDAKSIAEGKDIFAKNCVACHLADGGGSVGPNLTDKYWIHGGSPTDIYTVIKEGVLEKGMLSWKDKFSPYQIQNIVSYIETELQGSTPANPKAPQGEEYIK